MKRKIVTSLIAILVIAPVVMFSGCVEKPTPTVTSTPTPTASLTPVSTPTPTVTPTPERTSANVSKIIDERIVEFKNEYNIAKSEKSKTGRPEIRGMNYFHEGLGGLSKTTDDVQFEFRLMKEVLGVNAIRMWGHNDKVFEYVDIAHKEGLEVWLTYQPFFTYPNLDFEDYKKNLASFAKKADDHNVEVLYVGNELDLWGSKMVSDKDITAIVNEFTKVAEENYNGKITYATYKWDGGKINWDPMDVVSINQYLGTSREQDYLNSMENMKDKHQKPLVISEVGSLTITEAEKGGGDYTYVMGSEVHHDEVKQAEHLEEQLKLIYLAEPYAVFVFCWDEPAHSREYDKNKYAFGIWDHVEKRPKEAFFVVQGYFS